MMSIQKICKNIGDYGCLMLCWYFFIKKEECQCPTQLYQDLLRENIIEEDCYIKDNLALIHYLTDIYPSKLIFVNKEEVLESGRIYIVKWCTDTHTHFTVEKWTGSEWLCLYDPLGESNTRTKGYPAQARYPIFE